MAHTVSLSKIKWSFPPIQRYRKIIDLFPWTRLGLLILAISIAVLKYYAYTRLDLVLLVVGYMSLGLPMATALMVSGTILWLRPRIKNLDGHEKKMLETYHPVATGFSMPSLRWIPLIQIRWNWINPTVSEVKTIQKNGRRYETVRMDRRGRYSGITRKIMVEDALGLSRMTFILEDATELDVLPYLGNLHRIPSLHSLAGGDELPHPMGVEGGDRLELQRYTPGDPARFIHWKVFGRTGKLMVRMQERALSTSHRTYAFFLAGPEDEATAAVARIAIEQQLLGTEWLFGSDEDISGTSDRKEALDILIRSTKGWKRAGTGLGTFMEQAQKQGEASLLIFAPPTKGDWLTHLKDIAQKRKVHVVIGTDGIGAIQPQNRWTRWILLPNTAENRLYDELRSVFNSLSQTNFQISVFDRRSGQAVLPLL